MDKRFRFIIRNITKDDIFTQILTTQEMYQGKTIQYSNQFNKYHVLSIDRDTGLKDIDGESIFENDLLFSDQFVKPVVVTYNDDLGLWTDNTYTEELYKSIYKFKLKVIGNKTENENLLK
ncbi:YopX family protein [Clostridium botulinum]|uniref:YopX family protein n=1 Tax=Clostridium botulinum TaxID=1491 RepID=UPI001E617846|nr:YopX family protein [Clostridium botulinum]MCD3329308.1 hypothetical protein [Clostridium botulinum D/C]MCD3344527.1 hypothetical protein [Clostridium botulinum D/C]MCD3353007.1 hypothetical protein [Clostridium botulinum D/C]